MMKDRDSKPGPGSDKAQASVPTISLPKGGGAIRGIGEKFAANPVSGTGSMSVPIAVSPGRSGFGPQLALSYDSGAGNGPFGFGWSLSLPQIARKTDKGLPQYRDADESDVFILSGSEDLVPLLDSDGRRFERAADIDGQTYTIHRYRPRIEGLLARIERWTRDADGDVHWRSISKDNILTLYGKDANSRIAEPDDPHRIFSWLICETRDDKGNAVLYEYKPEDGAGVDLTRAHERNRGDRDDPRRTANRYPKHIRYGNRVPLRDSGGRRPRFLTAAQIQDAGWMFEAVFDYGEHHADAPKPDDAGQWTYRADPFSSYRAGFEVRTTRLCQRVLMFHHFPAEEGVGSDCLVRSTDFTYSYEQDPLNVRNPVYTFLCAVTQTGYRRNNGGYETRGLPPVEFEYTLPIVPDTVQDIDVGSLENLPVGLDGASYQWTDLHGEGIPGILSEQAGAWFYKRNLSPISDRPVEFARLERVAVKPNLAVAGGQAQFMDLAGDGQPDLVVLDGPMPGLYEHDGNEGWQPFRPFTSRLSRDTRDPNLKLVDLDGDGHADVLIAEDDAFVWHASLAEDGFGPARRVAQALDEEKGPRLVFADGTQSIYLADLSGDGLTDLVRIRNGEACYWPNLGYGRFGPKVTMDNAPWFDTPDHFDHKRIRLADIDGTGTTDLIYLHRDGVRFYFNQSGNGWSEPQILSVFPRVDDLVSIMPADLLGNGTACLVWSSPLPGDGQRRMRYVSLMGGQKPHLLIKTVNNLGAETRVEYAPSTKFYLQDKRDGKPWITRLPFPVHLIERVETYDHISRNRFVTRYAYHHGYFDGEEREFRGFGMVEQWDTEEIGALMGDGTLPEAANIDIASHVPPVHTKTWFHTGVYLDGERISRQFEGEHYREPGLTDQEFRAQLLPDTRLPPDLTLEEDREACRALKGTMLRQEVYGDDAPPGSSEAMIQRARTPYTVVEQSFTIRILQRRAGNRHAVFFPHSREAVTYHYERNPADPRIQHSLTLEVDKYGNVLKEAVIGYGRRQPDLTLPLQADRDKQTKTLITYTENRVTNDIEADSDYRTPLPCESRTYELTGYTPTGEAGRFQHMDFVQADPNDPTRLVHVFDSEIKYEEKPANGEQRRLIEHVRTLYRPNEMGVAQNDPLALLPLGTVESLALPGESYKLAFTPGLLTQVFQRDGQPLLPNPANVLAGQGADRGGYVDLDNDSHGWIPSGRVLLSRDSNDTAAQERAYAQSHFFLPRRQRDPFGQTTRVTFDPYDLLMLETCDALGNRVTVGERDEDDNLTAHGNDYRVLQPRLAMDPNRNRTQVTFDALGMVVGTAVMGKPVPAPVEGDSLDGFEADLTEGVILDHLANPPTDPHAILGRATTRLAYDLFAYHRTKDQPNPQPAVVYTLARETHDSDLESGEQTKIQHSFSYSDGFGREIQKKIQAEPGQVPKRDAAGKIIMGADGRPQMTTNDVSPRWVGSGWTIFNNKGKPVRKYEPFFTDTHLFEFDVRIGASPVLFYDPVERVVATLHPNHTWEKVAFDPWRQETWDVNDTVLVTDPKTDPDVGDFFRRLPEGEFLPTWHALRTDPGHAGVLAARYPDATMRENEARAAEKTQVHAGTPAIACFDTLGRPFLTIAHNKVRRERPDGTIETIEEKYPTRVELDIEGNQRVVRDAITKTKARDPQGNEVEVVDPLGRIVMRYDYDMLGNRIHQASMEAGEQWTLTDVVGKPIRRWDSRGHEFIQSYDDVRRPTETRVKGGDGLVPLDNVYENIIYGEDESLNGRTDQELNLRGRPFLHYDTAGMLRFEGYDFKGNLRKSRRCLAANYKNTPDWNIGDPDSLLEAKDFPAETEYDALNRPLAVTTPDKSIYRPTFNEANLLDKVDVDLRGEQKNGQRKWTPFVANINYNAKGQRTHIAYANGATTSYDYDANTFRLIHLKTTRPAALNGLASQLFVNPRVVQDLRYTYDPIGNITGIEDAALKTVSHDNQQVEPRCEYTYDAVYRVIEVKGREHIRQTAFNFNPPSGNYRDYPLAGLADFIAHPNDTQRLRNYTERYEYDGVGNFAVVHHVANGDSWSRQYEYEEDSLIEANKKSNRLTKTTVGNGVNSTETYTYTDAQGKDVHGCMTSINSMKMDWDFKDHLQRVDLGGGGTAYYVYDTDGQRVRKVIETENGARQKEHVYIGGIEIYREFNGTGATTMSERESLHVMDDKQRIALVETRTIENSNPVNNPTPLQRYQLGDLLGSVSVELAEEGALISYEEYHPYGTTAFQAGRNAAEVSLKRYRYSGKERDEESGLQYYGARYYASWLARWVSCDPAGLEGSSTLYEYVRSNPLRFIDRQGMQAEPNQSEPVQKNAEANVSNVERATVSTDRTILASQPEHWRSKDNIRLSKNTRVQILSEGSSERFNRTTPEHQWRQVLILEGEFKEQIGWTEDVLLTRDPNFSSSPSDTPSFPEGKETQSPIEKCHYSISEHTLLCTSSDGSSAIQIGPTGVFSGVGDCKNNTTPACLASEDKGPIEPGEYEMVPSAKFGGSWWLNEGRMKRNAGDVVSFLGALAGKEVSSREGFFLHKGNLSLGCITIDRNKKNADAQEARDRFDELKKSLGDRKIPLIVQP
jgi:RHS repeat-associated protein